MMTEYIYSLVYTIIYVVLLIFFVEIFVSKKNINTYIFQLSQTALVIFIYWISYLFMDQMAIKQILVIIADTILIYYIYEAKIRKSLVLVFMFQACEVVIEYFCFVLLQNSFGLKSEDVLKNENLSFVMGLLCLMLMFCFISIIRKTLSRKLGYSLTEIEWLRFSVFPIFCIITIVALMFNFEILENSRQGIILIWIVGGLVVMNIMVFGLLTDALKRESKLADYKVIQERGKNDTEMYQSMIHNYNEQRKIVHEFKNHMECISLLIQHKEYDRLNDYILQIQDNINHGHDLMDTNNKLINMILNSKYLEACDKNILLVVKANDLSNISMEDQDLVIVLSNLINNAIEACEKSENKVIKLKIIKERKWLIIAATNNYEQEPLKVAGRYVTNKTENSQYHGIGIENIKDVIEKYGGTYVIKSENNTFQFSIVLPR